MKSLYNYYNCSEIPKDYKPTLKYVYIYLIIYQCHDEMKRPLG